jgi:hypothetical protein
MRSEKSYSAVIAVLCLGTFAGVVHAEEAWLRTMAVAAFPDVRATDAASTPTTTSSEISEGTDLKRAFGRQRSAHGPASHLRDLLPNPYGAANESAHPPDRSARGFDERVDETYHDARWSNPYAVARNTDDVAWSNPYVASQNTHSDERWFNPYVAVQNTRTDERWSNPYAASGPH